MTCTVFGPLDPFVDLGARQFEPRRPDLPRHRRWIQAEYIPRQHDYLILTTTTTITTHHNDTWSHPLANDAAQIAIPTAFIISWSGPFRESSLAQPQATLRSNHTSPCPVRYKRKVYTGDFTRAGSTEEVARPYVSHLRSERLSSF